MPITLIHVKLSYMCGRHEQRKGASEKKQRHDLLQLKIAQVRLVSKFEIIICVSYHNDSN